MSGNGPILTNVPLSNYKIGPKDPLPDDSSAKAFGRKITQHSPEKKYFVLLDSKSPFFRKARNYFHKTIAEREITKTEPQTQTKQLVKKPKSSEKVDTNSLDLENNPFLKADNLRLKTTNTTEPNGKSHPDLKDVAENIKTTHTGSQTLSGQSSPSHDVLLGLDKVANYENQGIPVGYLMKMQEVADEENVMIAVRPVEKICRTLIEEGYGSKGLNIKGKSSNWGPMAGFIPVNQHFSKVSGNPEQVAKYNHKNVDYIHVNKSAVQEQLHISTKRIKELETLGILQNSRQTTAAEGYSQALVFESKPKNGPAESFEAHQRTDGQWELFSGTGSTREKLMVIPLTADFDLLFVHSHYEDVDLGQQDKHQPFHPELGIVSRKKVSVINAMNTKFDRGDSKYNMVHHGADTENPVTEMDANLPATVIIPKKMLGNMGVYNESPVLVKTKDELANLYRTMQAAGIKVETNPLWDTLKEVANEPLQEKIALFGGRKRHD